MATGNDYDAQLREVSAAGASPEDAYWDLVTSDIEHAADVLRPIYDKLDGADGFVSIEVSPDLAHDTAGTVRQAKELWERIARPNVMIKIPATLEGIPAITRDARGGHQRQRDADLQPRALPAGDRRVPRRARTARRRRAATSTASRRWRRSSSAGSTPRPIAACPRATSCGVRPRSPTPSSRTCCSASSCRAHGGTRSSPRVPGSSARCGRRLRRRTRRTRPRSTSTSSSARDTVNTLAQASVDVLAEGDDNLRADAISEDVDGARKVLADLAGAGRRLRRRHRDARARRSRVLREVVPRRARLARQEGGRAQVAHSAPAIVGGFSRAWRRR